MEKIHQQRPEIIQFLQNNMEELFQNSCEKIQTELNINAEKIWNDFQNPINKCLNKAKELQHQNQKGSIQYLVFSIMQYGICFDRIELHIDTLDDGFYLDMQEASAHYYADFLQDFFRKDLAYLYKKASEQFVRIQHYEQVQIKKKYAEYYYSLLFHMVKELIDLVYENVLDSGISITDRFKIIFGEYMDNAVILHDEEADNEILLNRD
ncbi:MAG: hypothetical protein HFJ07_10150 [Lachnospiraceae bacterium]|nr:hypothetical protein [Lachnospiraceae bacterium]